METSPTPDDMEIVLAWEVFADSAEGHQFDLTCLERLDLVSEGTDGPCDSLHIDAFKLPLGAVVLICVPK